MNSENNPGENLAVIAITKKGTALGKRLHSLLPGSSLHVPKKFAADEKENVFSFSGSSAPVIKKAFHEYPSLVLIMSTGIAVRAIASELTDKKQDPGVVVIDEAGKSCISLVSGHLGGANKLAHTIATLIQAVPVITTASDVSGTISADMLGCEYGWKIEQTDRLTDVSAAIVNMEPVGIYQDAGQSEWQPDKLPDNFTVYDSLEELADSVPTAALIITDRIIDKATLSQLPVNTIVYRPKSLVIGIGCNRNTETAVIEEAIDRVLASHGLSKTSIRLLTTIDVKNDEQGITGYAEKYDLPVEYHSNEALKTTTFPSEPSTIAEKCVGTPSVAEGAALLSSRTKELLVPKVKYENAVTVAVARYALQKRGKLFLVGTGPGNPEHMTFMAKQVLDESDIVVGYTTYIAQIESMLGNQEIIATGMGAEVKRVREAVDMAVTGKTVSLVSGGDTGIYGMAALAEEMAATDKLDIEIEAIPGITAVVAAASRLGSPVSVDFSVISLSDYLIPIEAIYKRLDLAAQGDFVIALYNPRSKKRDSYLADARDIFLKYRDPSTPVGFVTNACRDTEVRYITDLEHMLEVNADMNTIAIIGNSTTFVSGDKMITPRGYSGKYQLS